VGNASQQFLHGLRQGLAGQPEAAPGKILLAGVSGGADSSALLLGLASLAGEKGFILKACHVNHGIRGGAADMDEMAARALCAKCEVDLDTRRLAWETDEHPSEEALRDKRFAAFRESAMTFRADALVLGHHADDLAETVMMRFLTGSGVTGLSGFPLRSGVYGMTILRPMRGITREAIHQFLDEASVFWRDDASNADRKYFRNRVRHDLLPLLARDYNPAIRSALIRAADHFEEVSAWLVREARLVLDHFLNRENTGNDTIIEWISLEALENRPALIIQEIFRQWMESLRGDGPPLRPPRGSVTDMLCQMVREGSPGSILRLPDSMSAFRDNERLFLFRASLPPRIHRKAILLHLAPVVTRVQNAGLDLVLFRDPDTEIVIRESDIPRIAGPAVFEKSGVRVRLMRGVDRNDDAGEGVLLDPAKTAFPLIIRTRRAGDIVRERGMSRTLKKWWNDKGITAPLRDQAAVIADEGGIVWAPGMTGTSAPAGPDTLRIILSQE